MLNTNNVTLYRNGRTLLKNVSFELEQGDFMVLLGGNGAGKSTLLKTIANSLPLSYQGSVQLKEQDLYNWSAVGLARERAVLSQNIVLSFPMTVLDVVLLGRYPYEKGRHYSKESVAIAYEVLDLMGVLDYAEQDVMQLSGGEQQRVQLARVLAQVWESSLDDPKLLLLDEPTSNLDIAYQHILLELLQDWVQKRGLVVLTILHDMNLAARYANKIGLLKDGRLLHIGTPKETLTSHWIHQAFGVDSIVQEHPIFDCVQVSTY